MKECPTCRRVYADESLNYCRADGTRLVNRVVRSDEAVTKRFSPGKLGHRSTRMKTD